MPEIRRGQIWWANLGEPRGSEPGMRRPVLVVQANSFNASRIRTVIVLVITSNLQRADAPGNILLPAGASGLPRDSVINISQVLTIDRSFLLQRAGAVPPALLNLVDEGLSLVLALGRRTSGRAEL